MNREYSKFGNPPIQIVESSSSGVKTEHRGRTFVILRNISGGTPSRICPTDSKWALRSSVAPDCLGWLSSRRLVTICVVLSRVPRQEEDIPF
jgi:hypothetical protein